MTGRFTAAAYDPFLAVGEARGMRRRRAGLLADAGGTVVEIGAGTGLNLAHYPAELTELVVAEPEPNMRARLTRRAADRPGTRVEPWPADDLRLPDGSVDAVVSTLVLCTVPDPARALAEIRRVLRPNGRLLFIEHVRSDRPRRARWQDRLERPWAAFGAGCRCNRPTLDLIRGGFELERVTAERWAAMPRIVQPLQVGWAKRAA